MRLSELFTLQRKNVTGVEEEGWVIWFPQSDIHAKVKLDSYLRLHGAFTNANTRTVWKILAEGKDPAELFDTMPDEFISWAKKVAEELTREAAAWVSYASDVFRIVSR